MKIGIDARLICETGVGRYIQNLLRELSDEDTKNTYVIFLRKKDFIGFKLPNARWSKRIAEVRWHTLSEQIIMPFLFLKEHLDLVHVPYFNVPIVYPGKYVVTIHDLTILHFDTGKASTLPYWAYRIRRFGYVVILRLAVTRASQIISVSKTVKLDIVDAFGQNLLNKIQVTYEGVDPELLKDKSVLLPKPLKPHGYFLYVGNAYPHKNIELMLDGYREYVASTDNPAHLVFVGPDDYFYKKLKILITSLNLSHQVSIFHGLADSDLRSIYKQSLALVFPSRMEGFGLPALEAIVMGVPVICSDIPVFHEILGTRAAFIDTTNSYAIAEILKRFSLYKRIEVDIKQRNDLLNIYSWNKMAQDTLRIYQKAVL